MEHCFAALAEGTGVLSSEYDLKLDRRLLASGPTAAASFPRFQGFTSICPHIQTFLQRNFAEISRIGAEVTATLWLEVRHKNNEFSECVGNRPRCP